ncbi:hypothetical protein pipiens_008888, partial [Culex pipiens pipiens]
NEKTSGGAAGRTICCRSIDGRILSTRASKTTKRVWNLRCSDQHLLANYDSRSEHVILPKVPRKSRTRYKDGIIVPYEMQSPEFEKSSESTPVVSVAPTSQPKRTCKSRTGDCPSMVETKYLLQEIPKINQELAEKLRAGETSVEMLATKTLRGRKPEQQNEEPAPEIVGKLKA